MPPTLDYPQIHPAPAAGRHRRAGPASTAIIFPGALGDTLRLNYRQLDDDVNRMANALAGLGVRKGDRVALLLPNCPQFVIGYYAALKLGAMVVAFNPLYSPREIEHQLNDCEARVIIVLSLFYKNVAEVRSKTKLAARQLWPTSRSTSRRSAGCSFRCEGEEGRPPSQDRTRTRTFTSSRTC